jgi:hypothetical protein
MLKTCTIALATLFIAGCGERQLLAVPGGATHSAMWDRLSNVCPVRVDDVLNIENPCASVSADGRVFHHVYAITANNYYLVAETVAQDRRLMGESVFRATLGIGPDDIPRIVSVS